MQTVTITPSATGGLPTIVRVEGTGPLLLRPGQRITQSALAAVAGGNGKAPGLRIVAVPAARNTPRP